MRIYGIANCDTVKKARAWLEEHGQKVAFHDYKKQGVPRDVLEHAARQLGWEALINKKGPTWRKQPDEVKASITTEQAAFEFLEAVPSVIKRPLLEVRGNYYLGFSADHYLQLFKE
jgi:Spx/MgsR family transcriptional regulator